MDEHKESNWGRYALGLLVALILVVLFVWAREKEKRKAIPPTDTPVEDSNKLEDRTKDIEPPCVGDCGKG